MSWALALLFVAFCVTWLWPDRARRELPDWNYELPDDGEMYYADNDNEPETYQDRYDEQGTET